MMLLLGILSHKTSLLTAPSVLKTEERVLRIKSWEPETTEEKFRFSEMAKGTQTVASEGLVGAGGWRRSPRGPDCQVSRAGLGHQSLLTSPCPWKPTILTVGAVSKDTALGKQGVKTIWAPLRPLCERPWCLERLKAEGEGGDRGWDGWMALLTWWTWV